MSRLIAPTGHTLDLPARHLTFGESPECDVPLTGGYGLAGLHFEIAPGTDGFSYLRDASGDPGTQVNGRSVTVTVLKEGDVIAAGQLTLRYEEQAHSSSAMFCLGSGSETTAIKEAKAIPVAAVVRTAPPVRLPSAGEIVTASEPDPGLPDSGPLPLPGTLGSRPGPLLVRKVQPERSRAAPSPHILRVACGVLLGLAAAAFCATDPGQRLLSPWISKIHAWNTARTPKPNLPVPPLPALGDKVAAIGPPGPAPVIIPQVPHEEITRRLLTERTQTLVFADLRQLIPSYNLMASQQGLPSQREMSEAFRKTYGAVIDPFEKLSLLQADAAEEFLIILTSGKAIELEKVIGQPARPGADGRVNSRIYTLKAGNRTLSAARFDAFTLLLGSPRALARAVQRDPGPQLREARCMFPETAHRAPGALIMVKRVNLPPTPGEGLPSTAFETIVTNLFLHSGGPSTLTLSRNPDISEKAFVDAAAPALKQQAAELAPALGTDAKALANISPGEINLTLNEASVPLPGGPALISSALENMARSFARAAPSMSTILQAQDAVMRFNTARFTGAETALRAATPREALQLLNEGIRGGGRYGGATFKLASADDQLDNLSSLLAVDETVGLVYRPDADVLSGSALALALKARNYRNAELLIMLWEKAAFEAGDTETPTTAARRVLAWAGTPEGRYHRTILGLPILTEEELREALVHLAVTERLLAWKPGEANYRSWVRLVHPNPRRDAERLAAIFNAASAGGAIPASATRDLRAALSLITRGAAGRGEHAGTLYKLDTFTPAELTAATSLLTLEEGKMKVTATPAGSGAALR